MAGWGVEVLTPLCLPFLPLLAYSRSVGFVYSGRNDTPTELPSCGGVRGDAELRGVEQRVRGPRVLLLLLHGEVSAFPAATV